MSMKQQPLFPHESSANLPTRGGTPNDWGEASEYFDSINKYIDNHDILLENEAQTRFDVVDRIIRDVLGWQHGQIRVEEPVSGERYGFIDYILTVADSIILIEAKKIGSAFPTPTKRRKLKLSGSVLGQGDIKKALDQAEYYARQENADIIAVTNGLVWVFYDNKSRNTDSYATLLFPFDKDGDAEQLFDYFAVRNVEDGSLTDLTNKLPSVEKRLLSVVENADGRVDRNSIADFIVPALNRALFKDAIVSDRESLEKCFVTTEARTRFDNVLQMHLVDTKPKLIEPAKRIERAKSPDQLQQIVDQSFSSQSPPVTIIIGSVGVGKTTYLKHFELISARVSLNENNVHWIYIDFTKMGIGHSPRKFIYEQLLAYIETDHPENPTDWKNLIEPAYQDVITSLAKGQYYQYYLRDKDKFWEKVTERIEHEANDVEPYIDRLFSYIAKQQLVVVVLDNVDLFENDELETAVFSEGLAFSEKNHVNVIISLRDSTFVKHQADSTFNAYQLRKLWLRPPDFREVLSARLSYSKKILESKSAKIPLNNGMTLNVPDLSIFFDVVQQSLLAQEAGNFIEYMANVNIRKGLELVTDFLTSGHIQADRAIGNYLDGKRRFIFQFHEVFRGAILGQWKYYQELKSVHCLNLFDARLSSSKLRLMRLHIVQYLWHQSRQAKSEISIDECFKLFSRIGATENHLLTCIKDLIRYGLVRIPSSNVLSMSESIILTATGGYYLQILTTKFAYLEACIFDTAISDEDSWEEIVSLTKTIELQNNVYKRMKNRVSRITIFLEYLEKLENIALDTKSGQLEIAVMPTICKEIKIDIADALKKSNIIAQNK